MRVVGQIAAGMVNPARLCLGPPQTKSGWARNRCVKSIVDPALTIALRGPHLFTVQPGETLIAEDLTPVRMVRAAKWRYRLRHLAALLPNLLFDPYFKTEPAGARVSVNTLRINHYVSRSKADLRLKYKDRKTMLDRDRSSHFRYLDRNQVEDPILASKALRVLEIIACVRETSSLKTLRGSRSALLEAAIGPS